MPQQQTPDWFIGLLYAGAAGFGAGFISFIWWLIKGWIKKRNQKAEENQKILDDQQRATIKENEERIEQLEKDLLNLRIEILETLLGQISNKKQ